jgi:hypothetical protein
MSSSCISNELSSYYFNGVNKQSDLYFANYLLDTANSIHLSKYIKSHYFYARSY